MNSSHHQSVKAVAPSLIATWPPMVSWRRSNLPAHRFFLGIQWHPEFLFDRHPLHRRLFEAFLRAARATRPWRETCENRLVSLVYLVCLVGLVELDRPDEQNRPDEPDQRVSPVSLGYATERACYT